MAVCTGVLATSIVLFLSGHTYSGFWFMGVSVGVLAIPSLIFSHAKEKLNRSRREWLRTKAYCVCPECLYDLTQVPSPGSCPECGTMFVAEQLPDVWRRVDERWEERQRTSGTGG